MFLGPFRSLFGLLILTPFLLQAQSAWIHNDVASADSVANWTLHGQLTTVYQMHNKLRANYSGEKSLISAKEEAMSISSSLFLGRKLWKGAALYVNPEIAGGYGLSGSSGLAGFPNGEIYRVGNPRPTLFLARGYLQQHFALGADAIMQKSSQNQLAGNLPSSRITLSVGKFCLMDFFDDNLASHDARTQFLNWSLMGHGAWDFAADVRGYTTGMILELIKPMWAIRGSIVQVPNQANSAYMENDWSKGHAFVLEVERKWMLNHRVGYVHLTGFSNLTHAPKYEDAIHELKNGVNTLANIISGKEVGNPSTQNYKYGLGLSLEQEIVDRIYIFSRLSWNDGKCATWAFTEIDNSMSLGVNANGHFWNRSEDSFGLAVVSNGISQEHQDYLNAGGIGFMVGDGKLSYGRETTIETFYQVQLSNNIALTADYQLVFNPAYNTNRITSPISIPAIRMHAKF